MPERKKGQSKHPGRRPATIDVYIEANDLLKAALVQNEDGSYKDEHGFVAYRDGQDDDTIAGQLNCSPASVAHVRKKRFGKKREARSMAQDIKGVTEQLKAQESAVLALIEEQADQLKKLQQLAEQVRQLDAHNNNVGGRIGTVVDSVKATRAELGEHSARLNTLETNWAATRFKEPNEATRPSRNAVAG